MSKNKINETVSGGSIGAGGIATAPASLLGSKKTIKRPTSDIFSDFMKDFGDRLTNKVKMKEVPFPIKKKINESENFEMSDIISRLKSVDGIADYDDTSTYGVEDDNGNLMKITVPSDQSEEFEYELGRRLADELEDNFSVEDNRNISIAEVLYDLKRKFDIVDVEFPKIPSDIIYNSDEAEEYEDEFEDSIDSEQFDDDSDEFFDQEDDSENFDDSDSDFSSDEDSEDGEDDEMGLGDDESVEDFTPDEEDSSEDMLNKVLDMLKAQAETEKAKAEAEAEKYRAEQATHSARAAEATISQEEELQRMEAEQEKAKEEEKQAKKLADLAKFRAKQNTSSFREGLDTSKFSLLNELDDFDTVQSLSRQRNMLRRKYQPDPDDDQETRQYKQRQYQQANREIAIKIKRAKDREQFKNKQDDMEDDANNSQQENQNSEKIGTGL